MKNWDIDLKGMRNLWKTPGTGVTWFAAALETDRTGLICFLCLGGFMIFDLEVKKKASIV